MHRAFNLKLSQNDEFPLGSYEAGQRIHVGHKERIATTLAAFVSESGALNATKMRDSWFPQVHADVFISHSHADERTAVSLAGWLKRELDLTAFVDSCVWGYADDLLRQIDDQLCYQRDEGTYSYEKRNGSTSHVHMMLSTALSHMMDACECVFFLNTPASILPSDVIKAGGGNTTLSPWLYFEIAMTRIIRRRDRREYRNRTQKTAADNLGEALNIQYNLELNHLFKLDVPSLNGWREAKHRTANEGVHSLDLLYSLPALT